MIWNNVFRSLAEPTLDALLLLDLCWPDSSTPGSTPAKAVCNLSWITLFYALPKELVEKRPAYLELPRNIHRLLHSEEYRKLIESDSILELVWDCYAWSAWQFFQVPVKGGTFHSIPGDWSNYSGDFPLWRLSYEIIKHFREKFETEMEWSFQRLFLMGDGDELPWLSYKHFGNMVGNLTDMIV